MMGETTSYSTDTSDENFGPDGAVESSPDLGNVDPDSGRDRDAGASDDVLDATHPTQIEANDDDAEQASVDDERPDTDTYQDRPDNDEL